MRSRNNPDGILFEPGADPDAPWAITRQQPVASLLAEGVINAFTRSRRPPPVLMGKTLTLHAGTGEVALIRITDAARHALEHDDRMLAARDPLPPAEDDKAAAASG